MSTQETTTLKLMAILAHPDDESLGMGGTIARYADEGIGTYLVCATRGERGRYFDDTERPPIETVASRREKELRNAAQVLGIREVYFLDYLDKDLDQADAREAVARIAGHIRRVRPQVAVTFGPEGGYGHPDHIAISQFAGAAIVAAADPAFADSRMNSDAEPHAVDKLYYMAWTEPKWDAYQAAFKKLTTTIDGIERQVTPWMEWAITTRIDTSDYWSRTWDAIKCHETQLAIYRKLEELDDEYHRSLWGTQEFYRVFSRVNGGREKENDLFAGLR